MGNNCQPILFVDRFERRFVRKARRDRLVDAEPEDVASLCRDLDPGNCNQPVLGGALDRFETCVDLVVVCDRDRVEADSLRLTQNELDRVSTVIRERRMGVKFDRQHIHSYTVANQKRADTA